MISAIVLAAGLSTRMGRLKQLLPYGEHTVIEQVVSVLLATSMDEVLVITGHERAAVETVVARWPVRTVFNPHYADGEMLSSVQAGLRAVAAESQAALLALGDMPALEGHVVRKLIRAYLKTDGAAVCIPSYRMRAGHPVLVPRAYWSPVLALPARASLRSVLRAKETRVEWVVVDTPWVLRDMDTPGDYERELRMHGRSPDSGCSDELSVL
jgi:molybdenum cofactor cytidylyltransferase